MPKYKVGDVAALFPNPAKPKTNSGKKIQALFEEFYNKPSNPSKKWKKEKQFQGNQEQVEGVIIKENVEERKQKKKDKKRKLQNSDIPDAVEDAAVNKKAKLEHTSEAAPFPRHKKGKNAGSHFKKEVDSGAEETSPVKDSEIENGFQKTKSKEPALFPRRKFQRERSSATESYLPKKKTKQMKDLELENIFPENTQKKRAKETFGESETEPTSPKKKSKKAKKKQQKQETNDSDAPSEEESNVQVPNEFNEQKSKVVFRMKKKRDIPSVKDIFPKPNPIQEEADSDSDGETSLEKKSLQSLDKNVKKHKKVKIQESEERTSRTLFVGNLALSTTKKALEKLFSRFGPLESCRLRGAVPTKVTIPKKVADIKKKYHSGQNSRIGYVVFQNRQDAIGALALSGMLIDEHHIVVDRANASGHKKEYDEKRTIFVGNLPYQVDDEVLWSYFRQCGDVEAVRVIRDKETGVGKGFGYILFQKIRGKENALSLPEIEMNGRVLRVKSVEGDSAPTKQYKARPQDTWRNATKRMAFKLKDQQRGNPNSRKSLKKLMKKSKQQHQKKKIAGIFKKFV